MSEVAISNDDYSNADSLNSSARLNLLDMQDDQDDQETELVNLTPLPPPRLQLPPLLPPRLDQPIQPPPPGGVPPIIDGALPIPPPGGLPRPGGPSDAAGNPFAPLAQLLQGLGNTDSRLLATDPMYRFRVILMAMQTLVAALMDVLIRTRPGQQTSLLPQGDRPPNPVLPNPVVPNPVPRIDDNIPLPPGLCSFESTTIGRLALLRRRRSQTGPTSV